ncbi:hypothetical protein Sango_2937100 [Sesamum angolense]|uniref:Uncharacterized protein n=1 Tax=Sesamum angolense TaxID=2727404 RepID=A0AAE1T3U2_9LAMI|nr:hypothetical protein Sango_2937100 [Sesamum angolense]
MKELFAGPDWKIRYAMMKAFFNTRMIEGSSIREHGVMMLSLVEKLKDLQADFQKEEMYVDVILQSLPPSFDQFIINYSMNRLEKTLPELINMTRKKDDTSPTNASTLRVPVTPLAKRKVEEGSSIKDLNDVCNYCREKGPNLLSNAGNDEE